MPRLMKCWLLVALAVLLGSLAHAQDKKSADKTDADTVKADAVSAAKAAAKEADDDDSPKAKPKYPPASVVLKDATKLEGLITLHKKETQVFAEIPSSIQNKDLIMVISIARGIGQQPLLGGMSWGFGDDWIWQFRKVDDTIRIVRRNVRFTANKGSPEDKAVGLAYTDSTLFSLPIATISSSGAPVIDLTPVFMSDVAQLSQALSGFVFSSNKSNWRRSRATPTTSNSKSPPLTPAAVRKKSTRSPTAEAPRSTFTTRSVCCPTPVTSRVWPMIASDIS